LWGEKKNRDSLEQRPQPLKGITKVSKGGKRRGGKKLCETLDGRGDDSIARFKGRLLQVGRKKGGGNRKKNDWLWRKNECLSPR